MDKIITHPERCKGCYYCVESCPKKALTISEHKNDKGYQYVDVNRELCVACGTCIDVCPDFVYEISDQEEKM